MADCPVAGVQRRALKAAGPFAYPGKEHVRKALFGKRFRLRKPVSTSRRRHTPDLDAIVDAVSAYWQAGFTDIAVVQIGGEHQDAFFEEAVVPLLAALRSASGGRGGKLFDMPQHGESPAL